MSIRFENSRQSISFGRTIRKRFREALLLVSVVLIPRLLLAQVTAGTTEGSLRGADGHPLAGAAIVVTGGAGFRSMGDRRELTIKNLGPQTTDESLLCLFIVCVTAFFFIGETAPFDPAEIERLTHPPAAIRLDYIMRHVERWCRENRPTLLLNVTPSLFQQLLWTVKESIWGRNAVDWPEQGIFAKSLKGQNYLNKINAAYDKLQGRKLLA